MPDPSRRAFALGLAACAGLAVAGLAPRPAGPLVVIGGGPAGAAAALALRRADPRATVLLIERDPARLAAEDLDAPAARFGPPRGGAGFARLTAAGVAVMLDDVMQIDWAAARLELLSGRRIGFDRVFLAPGTAARSEAIAGLDAHARHAWPAAWGNAREARRLAAQLAALPAAGHVVLRLPPAGLGHPRAALGRALALAQHLAAQRPAARLTVLDADPGSALAPAFARAAARRGLSRQVSWLTAADGAGLRAVDARRGLLETGAGPIHANVVNFIPPQRAGTIAVTAGLVDDSGWCPCDGAGRSARQPGAVILGDARKGATRTLAAALASARRIG
ncbi:FAD-dependent oxidoreductase [Frigidibacter mobilis]|uniref:FAD-dependent pyridine nucleotide-disulfide oxidoreductase n=1 Tax=Frigidibacter mobilis TaxID=1335048 RepID=A0A159Z1F3_9RHOB|nr:FAD-dependent oxidoreductase [Frigidibacter mobilis]AMY68785.1 FAD-dependent pyridine nucleotide-disulfide oxidoreductase [Frigidibacter mobilis]